MDDSSASSGNYQLMTSWREVASYIGFGPQDSARLAELLPWAEPSFASMADRFYAAIQANEKTAAVLTGPDQVERLKGTLIQWLRELLTGPHDEEYWARRRMIGRVHVRVGLPNQYVFGAMNIIRRDLTRIANMHQDQDQAQETCLALQRVTDIELAVMSGTWMELHEAQALAGLQAVIVENLPTTVLCLDVELRVTSASRRPLAASEDLTAYLDPALIKAAALHDQLAQAIEHGRQVSLPRVVTPQQRHYHVTILPLEHPLARVLVHVDEVTDSVRVEARLRRAEYLAQIGSLAANVAHEIRNPLAAINATLQVIVGSLPPNDDRRGVLDAVQGHVHRLDRLVTDLLSFARPVETRSQRIDLVAVARVAAAHSAAAPKLSLPDAKCEAMGDAFYLQQILVNLLQNARAAAGSGGEVVLQVTADATIRVVDTGPGIDPSLEGRLFEPFVTTKSRGTGLGLAISRKLAQAMGGELVLTAERGEQGGAEFELTLCEPSAYRT